jgi:two-component system, NtrC family, nitrogen regulation sensor histidine kinase NtrY
VWLVVVLAAGIVAAEWLRHPAPTWVGLEWACVLAAAAALWPFRDRRRLVLIVLLAGLALGTTLSQRRLTAIEARWPEERERRVSAAFERLKGELHSVLRRAEGLADAAARVPPDDRAAAFRALERLTPKTGPEMSVIIFDTGGLPWAWAGQHRLPPTSDGETVGARASRYYVVLEARRHSVGRSAVAGVLIWAHPAVPERGRSLAELFRGRHEVGLTVYPPGTGPDSPDVFIYDEPTTTGRRLLFRAQPVPPEQGAAKELAYQQGSRAVIWLLLATFVIALSLASNPAERFLLLPLLLWLAVRAPLGAALGLQPLFSPATFFRPVLGPISSSAGVLALTGTLLSMAGVWLWRRKLPRRWYGVVVGAFLIFASPYLISGLGRGITPPARGVPIGLWLTWQLTLLVSVSALIVGAAALFRGNGPESHTRWRIVTGVSIAFAASIIGILVWQPGHAWPEWYTFLWTPALLLVTLPAPRGAAIGGMALVAGSSAALVTWGAELSGRLQVAQRDIARLGSEPDPLALPLLERLGEEARRSAPPASASELYALWHGSSVGHQGYPAHLALWSGAGELVDELTLDSLDLPPSLLATLVRNLPQKDSVDVVQLTRVPGVHYILLVRVAPGEVMTASVGPRTELILPGRVGRLLDPSPHNAPLYTLTLVPPSGSGDGRPTRTRWRREGWSLHSEAPITLPGVTRSVHAEIDLRGPLPLLVRGVLVVLLDAAVLALLWFLAEFVAGARPRLPRWRSMARSFRVRLAVTLGLFFILPAVGFAAWSFARLGQEAERSRDLLIRQTLRDAILSAGEILRPGGAPTGERLVELSRRIDADLALFRGGRLAGTSTPVLADLGVVGQLMDPQAYEGLALDGELEVTQDGSIPELAERVGYRVIQPGSPSDIGVLATPQLADDASLGARQLDLALVLLLATLAGVAAALAGARVAARTLSRPVAELRRSAIALGKGDPMPPRTERPPLEFEPVFGAFERMAADIRSSQMALEEARRRTAAVLATVATGVVGVDPQGKVLIANRQAVDILGTPLSEGEPFLERLSADWAPLASAVRNFLKNPETDGAAELDVAGRRLTLQLASLGTEVRGVVMALNDVTNISRAERVLAWGEMARQVAHEIKNPLTPMRLGMQHLSRVYRERRNEFDKALDETSQRILAEIDRLDTIARAFSRFAAPADRGQALDLLDLNLVVREVVQLYQLTEEGCEVQLTAEPLAFGAGRADEVKEVVVNLLENARNAGAALVRMTVGPRFIRVADNGEGIPAELLPRIFEPHFSTTTSGSGLGLAIVRRLVESWGGSIEVESEPGEGTTVTVRLV